MDTAKFELWVMDYLSDRLDTDEKQKLDVFLRNNLEYQQAFDALQETWQQLNEKNIPEPSVEMDEKFYHMLGQAQEKDSRRSWVQKLKDDFGSILFGFHQSKLAFGIVILAIGLTAGYFLNTNNSGNDIKTTEIVKRDAKSEEEVVQENLVLTLLDQPSANQRLEGISEAGKIVNVDEKVIKALLKTLNNDPNVNVRLAAIESLTQYANDPMVREGLVQAIVKQESPILQVTLANLMVALQEKTSIEPFRKLMRSKELDSTVAKQIERSIQSII